MYQPPSGLTFQLLMKEERLSADEPSLLIKSFSALPSSSPHSPADLFHKLSVTLTATKSCNNSKYNTTKHTFFLPCICVFLDSTHVLSFPPKLNNNNNNVTFSWNMYTICAFYPRPTCIGTVRARPTSILILMCFLPNSSISCSNWI